MPTNDELQFEMERRIPKFEKNTTMPDGSILDYTGDPNNANTSTTGQALLYYSPAGSIYIDKTEPAPYTAWQKVEDGAGGEWKKIGSNNSLAPIFFTDPAPNEATSTAVIDNYDIVFVQLLQPCYPQYLQEPTDITKFKMFTVVHLLSSGDGLLDLIANTQVSLKRGFSATFIWTGSFWMVSKNDNYLTKLEDDIAPRLSQDLHCYNHFITLSRGFGLSDINGSMVLKYDRAIVGNPANGFGIETGITGVSPILRPYGLDTDLDFEIESKGTGVIKTKNKLNPVAGVQWSGDTPFFYDANGEIMAKWVTPAYTGIYFKFTPSPTKASIEAYGFSGVGSFDFEIVPQNYGYFRTTDIKSLNTDTSFITSEGYGITWITYEYTKINNTLFMDNKNIKFYDGFGITDIFDHKMIIFQSSVSGSQYLQFKNSSGGSGFEISVLSPYANEDLILKAKGDGAITVGNTLNYEAKVTANNDIPNRKFVTDYALGFEQTSYSSANINAEPFLTNGMYYILGFSAGQPSNLPSGCDYYFLIVYQYGSLIVQNLYAADADSATNFTNYWRRVIDAGTYTNWVEDGATNTSSSSNIVYNKRISGAQETVFYDDDYISFKWISSQNQFLYYPKVSGWHDAYIEVWNGSIRYNSDDISTDANQWYYFTRSGALNTSFNAVGYGSKITAFVTSEGYNGGLPTYELSVNCGNIQSIAITITRTFFA